MASALCLSLGAVSEAGPAVPLRQCAVMACTDVPVAVGSLSGCECYRGRNRYQMNAIKNAIKSGRTVVGTAGAPNVDVSILADAGYDFLLFDTQHSPWEIKQLQPPIQAMRGKKAAPMVRVAANLAHQICFALDGGARGIVVPMVNTRAEAEALV